MDLHRNTSTGPPLSGWIQKRGRINPALKWRWFQLDSTTGHWNYFKSPEDAKGHQPLGYINLHAMKRDPYCRSANPVDCVFKVDVPGRTFTMKVANKESLRTFMDALRLARQAITKKEKIPGGDFFEDEAENQPANELLEDRETVYANKPWTPLLKVRDPEEEGDYVIKYPRVANGGEKKRRFAVIHQHPRAKERHCISFWTRGQSVQAAHDPALIPHMVSRLRLDKRNVIFVDEIKSLKIDVGLEPTSEEIGLLSIAMEAKAQARRSHYQLLFDSVVQAVVWAERLQKKSLGKLSIYRNDEKMLNALADEYVGGFIANLNDFEYGSWLYKQVPQVQRKTKRRFVRLVRNHESGSEVIEYFDQQVIRGKNDETAFPKGVIDLTNGKDRGLKLAVVAGRNDNLFGGHLQIIAPKEGSDKLRCFNFFSYQYQRVLAWAEAIQIITGVEFATTLHKFKGGDTHQEENDDDDEEEDSSMQRLDTASSAGTVNADSESSSDEEDEAMERFDSQLPTDCYDFGDNSVREECGGYDMGDDSVKEESGRYDVSAPDESGGIYETMEFNGPVDIDGGYRRDDYIEEDLDGVYEVSEFNEHGLVSKESAEKVDKRESLYMQMDFKGLPPPSEPAPRRPSKEKREDPNFSGEAGSTYMTMSLRDDNKPPSAGTADKHSDDEGSDAPYMSMEFNGDVSALSLDLKDDSYDDDEAGGIYENLEYDTDGNPVDG